MPQDNASNVISLVLHTTAPDRVPLEDASVKSKIDDIDTKIAEMNSMLGSVTYEMAMLTKKQVLAVTTIEALFNERGRLLLHAANSQGIPSTGSWTFDAESYAFVKVL